MNDTLQEIDRFIRTDPAARGLISSESTFGPLCPGHLAEAATHLAMHGKRIGIVTGFYVPKAEIPACETDGPLGALTLAAVLQQLGMQVDVITDPWCEPVVTESAKTIGVESEHVVVCSTAEDCAAVTAGSNFTHLISIERIGPCHTEESICCQYPDDPAMCERFLAEVSAEQRNRCHNMRGEVIDDHTAPLHLLFEDGSGAKTIGIGDGGNEIGMGTIPWHDLCRRLSGDHVSRVPCRIATDWTILAGTSNWGAYALAAAVAFLTDRVDVLTAFDAEQQERMLQHIVQHAAAVDGLTRRREPTVDGLPFITYIQPWAGIRRLLGLPE